jgi:hypothetical protein
MYRSEVQEAHLKWSRRLRAWDSERIVDDLLEATMMHTKSTLPTKTVGYKELCLKDYQRTSKQDKCMFGFARPLHWKKDDGEFRMHDNFVYNCYVNPKIVTEVASKLKIVMNTWSNATKAEVEY